MAAVDEAAREYAAARDTYVMERLIRVKAGEEVGPSILTGHDLANQMRRERTASENAGIDRQVRSDPRLRSLLSD